MKGNRWLPAWLPAAAESRGVVVEHYGRGTRDPRLSDMHRIWCGHYWHQQTRRGNSWYVVGDIHGPFPSQSAALDNARLVLGLNAEDAERPVARRAAAARRNADSRAWA